jgi:hypothetical protein
VTVTTLAALSAVSVDDVVTTLAETEVRPGVVLVAAGGDVSFVRTRM